MIYGQNVWFPNTSVSVLQRVKFSSIVCTTQPLSHTFPHLRKTKKGAEQASRSVRQIVSKAYLKWAVTWGKRERRSVRRTMTTTTIAMMMVVVVMMSNSGRWLRSSGWLQARDVDEYVLDGFSLLKLLSTEEIQITIFLICCHTIDPSHNVSVWLVSFGGAAAYVLLCCPILLSLSSLSHLKFTQSCMFMLLALHSVFILFYLLVDSWVFIKYSGERASEAPSKCFF